MHKKCGKFVRTGELTLVCPFGSLGWQWHGWLCASRDPDEITIFHPAAFEAMDVPNNNNTRSDGYDLVHPWISPTFSRDEESHIDRRRVWTQALSSKGEYSFDGLVICIRKTFFSHKDVSTSNTPGKWYHAMVCIRFDGRLCFQRGLRHDETR